jgi:hypothetical protein
MVREREVCVSHIVWILDSDDVENLAIHSIPSKLNQSEKGQFFAIPQWAKPLRNLLKIEGIFIRNIFDVAYTVDKQISYPLQKH